VNLRLKKALSTKYTKGENKEKKKMKTEELTTENTENTENTELMEEAGQAIQPDRGIEALQGENEALKSEIRMRDVAYEVEGMLAAAGARSPRLLVEAAKTSLQFGEDGKLTNAAAIVEHLKTQYPEQFGTERPVDSIDGGAGRTGASAITQEALAKMSPGEIAKLDWAEVRRVLAEG